MPSWPAGRQHMKLQIRVWDYGMGSSPFGQISLILFLDALKFRSLMYTWTESVFILVSGL